MSLGIELVNFMFLHRSLLYCLKNLQNYLSCPQCHLGASPNVVARKWSVWCIMCCSEQTKFGVTAPPPPTVFAGANTANIEGQLHGEPTPGRGGAGYH